MSQKIIELFSSTVELQEFNKKNINHIPSFGSIIYTVFLDRNEYIYVGSAWVGATVLEGFGAEWLYMTLNHLLSSACNKASFLIWK